MQDTIPKKPPDIGDPPGDKKMAKSQIATRMSFCDGVLRWKLIMLENNINYIL